MLRSFVHFGSNLKELLKVFVNVVSFRYVNDSNPCTSSQIFCMQVLEATKMSLDKCGIDL